VPEGVTLRAPIELIRRPGTVNQSPNAPAPQHLEAAAAARRGVLAVSAAFVIWGLFPLYLKPLTGVPAPEILAHRIAWCLLFVFGWLAWKSRLGEVAAALRDPATLGHLAFSAALIAINWGVYVWAVSNGRVLEASLGYFIGPLVNVLLGVVALKERLNPRQWTAVGFAAVGVAWLTIAAGAPPWVSLVLAVSFGIYGLVRKVVNVAAVPGLAIETVLLAPLALAWIGWLHQVGQGTFGHAPLHVSAMLIGSGLITALPLALFSTGARLIPYSLVGIITYIGPSLQLLSGVFVYGEPFAGARAVGFCIIWAGIAIFVADNILRSRRPLAAILPPT
jgi:chloramphenicol-sensitive protein RarD